VLSQTDAKWKEHLQAIKFLQQAVGLRGYASKDPLTEFKLEGYNLFVDMTAQIRRWERAWVGQAAGRRGPFVGVGREVGVDAA
jgi:preprotein translocase subunit SecA